jgi:predicted TIM-barrel fold metal-dependent hydrolase
MITLEKPRAPTPPTLPPPAGACDTHVHVFGPYGRFPLAAPPAYAPMDSPLPVIFDTLGVLGLDRAVLVQPAPYGVDHRALVDALQRAPQRFRGVAVVDADAEFAALQALHRAGVRGVRLIGMRTPDGRRYPGAVAPDALPRLAPMLRELGWAAHVWAPPAECAALAEASEGLGLPLVFDHLAGAAGEIDLGERPWRVLLEQLVEGRIWIKLSVCRVAWARADYPAARPLHEALVRANPGRLLWGSDFPFVRKGVEAPDAGWLLDLFQTWVADAEIARRILVDNPASLYGW